jgi:hypothetical protein
VRIGSTIDKPARADGTVVSVDLVLESAGIGEANALVNLVKEGQET